MSYIPKSALNKIAEQKVSNAKGYKAAFIRNLNEPYTIPASRTLLQNDGLRPGGFNTFGYEIWDTATQTLKPNKLGDRYFVRLSFAIKSTVSVVLDLDLEVGSSVINSPTRFQPYISNQWETQSVLLTFFVGGAFAPDGMNIVNGAQFFIVPTEPIEITNLSYDIFTVGGAI